jgi:DNA-binding MarR family transcriptional regulator
MKFNIKKTRELALAISIFPYHFFRTFSPVFDHVLTGQGFTKNQSKTMDILSRNGAMLPSELGVCLDMKRGSLTSLVDSLEEKGCVIRQPDSDDRRKIWIALTEKGSELNDVNYNKLQDAFGDFIEKKFSPEDGEALHSHMGAIIDILKRSNS